MIPTTSLSTRRTTVRRPLTITYLRRIIMKRKISRQDGHGAARRAVGLPVATITTRPLPAERIAAAAAVVATRSPSTAENPRPLEPKAGNHVRTSHELLWVPPTARDSGVAVAPRTDRAGERHDRYRRPRIAGGAVVDKDGQCELNERSTGQQMLRAMLISSGFGGRNRERYDVASSRDALPPSSADRVISSHRKNLRHLCDVRGGRYHVRRLTALRRPRNQPRTGGTRKKKQIEARYSFKGWARSRWNIKADLRMTSNAAVTVALTTTTTTTTTIAASRLMMHRRFHFTKKNSKKMTYQNEMTKATKQHCAGLSMRNGRTGGWAR
mmetsp:Transcript_3282/g.9318  ORF Transcript_3282/g.9318 Transcript_3282/m.9318 type:complete len:326 (-) Transcript_3282:424-1401(-)